MRRAPHTHTPTRNANRPAAVSLFVQNPPAPTRRHASFNAGAGRQPSGHGACDAGPHAMLAHRQADRDGLTGDAAERVEKHRKLAASRFVQEIAKPFAGIGIKISISCDPGTAARTTGIGRPVRNKKHQRLLFDLGQQCLIAWSRPQARRPPVRKPEGRRAERAASKNDPRSCSVIERWWALLPYPVATSCAML